MMERGWSIIHLEGYCGKDWDYLSKHSKHYYPLDSDDIDNSDVTLNPEYDPNVMMPEDPPYCVDHICYVCMENNCPYFYHCEYKPEEELNYD